MTHLRLIVLSAACMLAACATLEKSTPQHPVDTERHPAVREYPSLDIAVNEIPESNAERILRLVADAPEQCRGTDLPYRQPGSAVRPVILSASDGRTWRCVGLDLLVSRSAHGHREVRVTNISDAACTVRYLGGTGPVRFHVDLTCAGREFVVYRACHQLDVPRETVCYTPFHRSLYDEKLVARGFTRLLHDIHEAKQELRDMRVKSAAFPEQDLADVYDDELPVALALIEQTDHQSHTFRGFNALKETLIDYALNDEPFHIVCSHASACGPLQFTERTYSLMLDTCAAGLTVHTAHGRRDLLNSLKAALCLIDHELSNMPSDIRTLFGRDQVRAGFFLAAAYNAGLDIALDLRRILQHREVPLDSFSKEHIPYKLCKYSENGIRICVTETVQFLRKFADAVWFVIPDLAERTTTAL